MKYIIVVLLSALLCIFLTPKTPALTKTVVHNIPNKRVVRPQPEKDKPLVKADVSTKSKKKLATPVPKPEVIETAYASGCMTYDSIFRQYAWNVSVAEAICQAESGGNPYAYSSTQDAGLMQIHDGLYLYGSQIYNPSFNISKAYQKYQSQGWYAWTTYNIGAYRQFL